MSQRLAIAADSKRLLRTQSPRSTRSAIAFTIGCAWLAGACYMTKSEATERFEQQKRDFDALQAEVRANNLALGSKLKELEDGLEKSRALLTRDSADVGAQVQAQQQKMAELEGKLDEMTHNLQSLVEQTAKAQATLDDRLKLAATAKPGEVALDPSQIPSDKASHFAAAYDAYKASDHEKARALFNEYVKRYPTDDKAGDAQYWVGASYLVQNKPATALGEYRKVISNYPKSPAVDTALYGMADAFFRLHACTDAKGAIEALTKRKPSKALEDRAKQLGKAIKDAGKDYCTS